MNDKRHEADEVIAGLISKLTEIKNDIIEWMLILWFAEIVLFCFFLLVLQCGK